MAGQRVGMQHIIQVLSSQPQDLDEMAEQLAELGPPPQSADELVAEPVEMGPQQQGGPSLAQILQAAQPAGMSQQAPGIGQILQQPQLPAQAPRTGQQTGGVNPAQNNLSSALLGGG